MGLKCCCFCCPYKKLLSKNRKLTDEDMRWLAAHTSYTEKDVRILYKGFLQDFPNGGINQTQFEKFFQSNRNEEKAKQMSHMVFKTIDFNENGFLDFKELISAIDLVAAKTPVDKLIWAFKMYDLDNSGVINRKEMMNVMKFIYHMLGAVDIFPEQDYKTQSEILFEKFDSNSDGELSLEEFLRGCREDSNLMNLITKFIKIMDSSLD